MVVLIGKARDRRSQRCFHKIDKRISHLLYNCLSEKSQEIRTIIVVTQIVETLLKYFVPGDHNLIPMKSMKTMEYQPWTLQLLVYSSSGS